jgi:ABC-type sugar transport system ATPase subunit
MGSVMIPSKAEGGAPALEIQGLTKRFPGVLALDEVAFSLKPAEIHALIGQNGAGKSTLIKILSGIVSPDAGVIQLRGRPVSIPSPHDAIELGIGTVYQELSLLPNLTIAQNLALGREPRRYGLLDIDAMHTAARTALNRIGLSVAEDTQFGALSLAERQLVEIAKALSQEPSVLVLDEPTAALGNRDADRLFAILKGLRARGMSIVYVSHRFREILELCDRATVLRNGRVVTTTDLADWTEADLTEAMVGGRSEIYIRARPMIRGEPLLAARSLCYGNKVSDVSFAVARGEILSLTGLLGAGQNEIARIIGGDLRPDSGSITVRGKTIRMRHPADGTLAGVCLVSDDRTRDGILPNLALRENVALPSLTHRQTVGPFVDSKAERIAVRNSVGQFGIVTGSLETPIRLLSGGNQQKSLIARWHLNGSDVFILLEPTRGVDVAARADIYRRLDELAATGKALIVISSDIQDLLAIADRILVVREGRIAATTTPAETNEERLNLMIQGAA